MVHRRGHEKRKRSSTVTSRKNLGGSDDKRQRSGSGVGKQRSQSKSSSE
jgi:hypothetical protein